MAQKYLVVSDNNLNNFNKSINDHLEDGWEISGSLAVISTFDLEGRMGSSHPLFCQSLVKTVKKSIAVTDGFDPGPTVLDI